MTEQGNGLREDLLEMLTERLECTYLSDLKTPEHKAAIAGVLATISPEAYSLAQWNEALSSFQPDGGRSARCSSL